MSSPNEEVPLPNPEEFWAMSTVTEKALLQMVANGVLLARNAIGWREAAGERFPTPNTNELIVFDYLFY